ncbi:hypothetical protein FBY35_3983 [Streptomyces sp. SLBN-118]|uniref:hypothetical protein n=1 Tax=Streptomyces sp. SLBN-118 TaxID=2768454 RepID=UPI00115334EC|nr:hypothetical protein [Streptomyces sp. SLBN-118]TQK42561.1 hypothetical protein FBY35_3983 [Streptomyces sp. SLBN-118]
MQARTELRQSGEAITRTGRVRRACHRLDGDRAAPLPRRQRVARAELHVVGAITEPHVRTEGTRRVGQADHRSPILVPVEVVEGGVQPT